MKTLLRYFLLAAAVLLIASCTYGGFPPYLHPGFFPDRNPSTPYDVSEAEDFAEMLRSEGQARLTADITVNALSIPENAEYTIDLNGNQLLIESEHEIFISRGSDVTIEGGELLIDVDNPSVNPTTAFISVEADARLMLDGVTYTGAETGIMIAEDAADAELVIQDSTISVAGAFPVSTNAYHSVQDVNISIIRSELHTPIGTGLLFNVPGNLTITGSRISASGQAVIVRSGTAVISDSTLSSIGNEDPAGYASYLTGDWGEGNSVPLATLVVGNRGDAAYDTADTSCTVVSTKLEMVGGRSPLVYVAADNGITTSFISSQYAQSVADAPECYHAEDDATVALYIEEGGTPLDLD